MPFGKLRVKVVPFGRLRVKVVPFGKLRVKVVPFGKFRVKVVSAAFWVKKQIYDYPFHSRFSVFPHILIKAQSSTNSIRYP